MIVLVPLTGELKIYPFHDTFRVSFGAPAFLFFLLLMRRTPILLAGFMTGLSVVVFRIILDWMVLGDFRFRYDFLLHLSSFFYYLTYSLLFYLAKVNSLHHKPLLVGFLAVIIEIVSSVTELSLRHVVLGEYVSVQIIGQIIIIAVIRSFFVLGFFNIVKLHQANLYSIEQKDKNRNLLLLISSLHEESIQLKKSLQHAEDITRDCYGLYQSLQNNDITLNKDELAQGLLSVAGQVHEIKKDNQRIYAGISKLIQHSSSADYMEIAEIGNIVVQANQKYSSSLHKNIDFELNVKDSFPPLHTYTILSIVNNLVSNSVESIENNGYIKILIFKDSQYIVFDVSDNGTGIRPKKRELVYKPGYTTKYDDTGKPSTGMGLPYVKEVVTTLGGNIGIQDNYIGIGITFTIKIPINSLLRKG